MLELLKRNFEAYMAIKLNQANYDITIVISSQKIVRVQVKSTVLQNKSTNNSIKGINKKFDYLILMIRDSNKDRFFVLTKAEADVERGHNTQLTTSTSSNGIFNIKQSLLRYENKWANIV